MKCVNLTCLCYVLPSSLPLRYLLIFVNTLNRTNEYFCKAQSKRKEDQQKD